MLPSDPANPPAPSDPESAAGSPSSPATDPTPSPGAPTPALEVPVAAVRARSSARTPILAMAMVVVAVLAGGALFVSGFLVGQRAAEQPGTPVANAEAFQPFWDSYNTILKRFALGGANEQSLVSGAIKGMVDSLGDPFSAYLSPADYQAGLQQLSGQFEGIGAEIGTHDAKGQTSSCTTLGPDCILTVVSPLDGSP